MRLYATRAVWRTNAVGREPEASGGMPGPAVAHELLHSPAEGLGLPLVGLLRQVAERRVAPVLERHHLGLPGNVRRRRRVGAAIDQGRGQRLEHDPLVRPELALVPPGR